MNPAYWLFVIMASVTGCALALNSCQVAPAAAVSRPFEVYEMGDNCVYITTTGSSYAIAALPRGTAPNYYGRCQ